MKERVTLKPGDYVSTAGMTEDQYRAVEKAFLHAGGRSDGDHGFEKYVKGGSSSFLGWDKRSGEMWDCGHCAMGFARHLTPAQVIGAVNAGNQQEGNDMGHKAGDRFFATADSRFFSEGSTVRFTGEFGCFGNPKMSLVSGDCRFNNGPGGTPGAIEPFDRFKKINQEATMDDDFKLKCILHSAQKYLEEEREELERSDFHRVKAMQKCDRHDEMMQRARDMLPDGWRLVRDGEPEADMADPANWRIGDRVKCVADPASGNSNFADGDFEVGGIYTVHETDGSDCYGYLDESGADFYEMNRFFRFHSRPTT